MGCSPGSRSSSKVHSPRLTVPVPSIVCAKFTPGNTPEGTVPHPTRESSSSGGNGKERWSEGRVAGLERKIGQQAMELDLFERVLAAHREQRMLQVLTGNPPSTGRSKKKRRPAGSNAGKHDATGPHQPSQLLPLRRGRRSRARRRHGVARCDSTYRITVAQLR